MGLVLTDFRGILPGVANYDLPSNAASEAINCEFGGTVRPARFSTNTQSSRDIPVEVYNAWVPSGARATVSESPLADDSLDRIYILQDSKLKQKVVATGEFVNVGLTAPEERLRVFVKQPLTAYVPDGELQAPVGDQVIFQYAIAIYAKASTGVWYFSDLVTGDRVGYSNSELLIEFQQNWFSDFYDSATSVSVQVRFPYGFHICFMKSDNNGGWEVVAESSSGEMDDAKISIPFSSAAISEPVYNATYKLQYDDQAIFPPTPKSVTVYQPSVLGAGMPPVEVIPDGEVGLRRSYVYTRCRELAVGVSGNSVFEEGPPSLARNTVPIYSNSEVTVTLPSLYSEDENKFYNVYRSNSGVYMFVRRVNRGEETFVDNTPDSALGEECPSFDWLPPPPMTGFLSASNGFFIGWKDKTVYCSEVYMPSAWPVSYSYTLRYPIKFLLEVYGGFLAFTKNGNYIISGQSPGGLLITEAPSDHPCINVDTAVLMGDVAVYASISGLVGFSNGSTALMTEGSVDRNWWASLDWGNAWAYRIADLYVLRFAGQDKAYVFDMTKKTISTSYNLPEMAAYDSGNGKVIFFSQDGTLKAEDLVSAPTAYTWKSKLFEFNKWQSYGWTQCVASAYPVTVQWKLWKSLTDTNEADTTHSVTYTDHHPKRFPAGVFHRVQARIVSSNPVSKLVLTNNRDELEFIG